MRLSQDDRDNARIAVFTQAYAMECRDWGVASLLCPKCLSQVTQTTFDGVEYCPICQTKLPPKSEAQRSDLARSTAKPQAGRRALGLFKEELSKAGHELVKKLAGALLEKWRLSGTYPPVVDAQQVVESEAVLLPAIKEALSGAAWEDDNVVEFLGKLETSVSVSFPLALETGVPSIGRVTIPRVRLIITGTVDVISGAVTDVRIGAVDLPNS